MALLQYANPDEASPETLRPLEGRRIVNIYRVILNAPTLAPGMLQMISAIFHELSLAPTLRELATLRVGSIRNSAYELHHHRRLASAAGVPDWKVNAAIDRMDDTRFDPDERLVLECADAVLCQGRAPAELVSRIAGRLGKRETTELILVIGFYEMVSTFLETLEIDIDPPVEGGL